MGLIFNFSKGGFSQEKPDPVDRKPAAAGRFYPADAKELRTSLAELFAHTEDRNTDNVQGVVCPHAGYVFSGKVAASGYNQVDPDKQFDNVFVIASSHHVSFNGASIYNQGDYLTPLGKVTVNIGLANTLISENPAFVFNAEADRTEHSLEVQIPFLQFHLRKEFKLVPIILGTQSAETCKEIAKALKPYFNNRNLFVFSTDFSHYPSYADAQITDKATCDAILTGSSDSLMKFLHDYSKKNIPNLATNLCGWTTILVMLGLIDQESGDRIQTVKYQNSGDSKYGDKNQVVGYWSLALTKPAPGFDFSRDEKIMLLQIARKTMLYYVKVRQMPDDMPGLYPESLNLHAGAFVTLRINGELRGCIGRFSSELPLHSLIKQMAVASSAHDSRFEPVTASEADQLEIEISVLSPLKKADSPDEIILGKHGIYLKKGFSTGTFLPQVATETGWNLEEFLGHCARDKAGIGWDGWKNAEIFTYEACVFSERDFNVRKD